MASGSVSFSLRSAGRDRHVQFEVTALTHDDDYVNDYQVDISSDSMSARLKVIVSTDSGGDGLADFLDRLAQTSAGRTTPGNGGALRTRSESTRLGAIADTSP